MKTYDAVIYFKLPVSIELQAENEDDALAIIEDNINSGKYDDDIIETVGTYFETHSIDLTEIE